MMNQNCRRILSARGFRHLCCTLLAGALLGGAIPAAAGDRDSGVGPAIAAQGNAALVEIRRELTRLPGPTLPAPERFAAARDGAPASGPVQLLESVDQLAVLSGEPGSR